MDWPKPEVLVLAEFPKGLVEVLQLPQAVSEQDVPDLKGYQVLH